MPEEKFNCCSIGHKLFHFNTNWNILFKQWILARALLICILLLEEIYNSDEFSQASTQICVCLLIKISLVKSLVEPTGLSLRCTILNKHLYKLP